MGIRLTGLTSGLDTESIVEAMMEAHRTKLTKIENKKTVLEWKQDKWKDLNTKLYKLYQEQTSKLRLTSNYNTKKVSSADESVVKVTADKNATQGTHAIAIKQLASSQYVTGSKLGTNGDGKDINGNTIKTSTKLTDLGMEEGTRITITAAGGTKELEVTSSTSLNDYLKACNSVGLNASYDEKQKRLFLSSAKSGADQEFSIEMKTYGSTGQYTSKANVLNNVNDSDKSAVSSAFSTIESNMSKLGSVSDRQTFMNSVFSSTPITESDIDASSDSDEVKQAKKNILAAATTIKNAVEAKAQTDANTTVKNRVTEELSAQLSDSIKDAINGNSGVYTTTIDGTEYTVNLPKYDDAVAEKTALIQDKYLNELKAEMNEAAGTELDFSEGTDAYNELMQKYNDTVDNAVSIELPDMMEEFMQTEVEKALASTSMKKLLNKNVETEMNTQSVKDECNALTATNSASALTDTLTNMNTFVSGEAATTNTAALDKLGLGSSAVTVAAADCIVEYNGAELTSSSNSINVNGLTFEAISISAKDSDGNYKSTSVTVTKDTQGMYDMVKNFITEYNSVLKEMNTLYYADSARGYDPLTDEEKEAMTDEQIELWENKIKDASLRRDTTLGGISTVMKQAMSSTVEVDGKKYSLSSFGIMTSKDYTEKGLLHIYGDQDDATYSDKDDKLMKAIEEDPDLVAKVMSKIVDNLHDSLMDKMSKTSLSSALTFYNDKQIDKQLTQYKKDIATMEDKLKDKENAYYKQFTAMETALSKLQSQTSSLSGLLGTN
ncbi:flagellar filament capping protein FliD [Anaerosporobacter sp.]